MNRSLFHARVIVLACLLGAEPLVGCSSSAPSASESTGGAHSANAATEPSTITVAGVGTMSFENDYIPGVVSCESGVTCSINGGLSASACLEQLKAQAVASRTYVLHQIEVDPTLGTPQNPVAGDATFQCWHGGADATAHQAASDTRGQVMTYAGDLIEANFDSGGYAFDASGHPLPPSKYGYPYGSWDAARSACCSSGNGCDSACIIGSSMDAASWTQAYVTDFNAAKSGGAVTGTLQDNPGPHNRGAWGQWESAELAYIWKDGTFDFKSLLRAFYGADIGIGQDGGSGGGSPGGSNPCSGVSSADNGTYCGSSTQSGFAGGPGASPTTLYVCENGAVASTQSCDDGCEVAGVGAPDSCYGDPCTHVPAADDGLYCGKSAQNGFAGASSYVVYDCAGGRTASIQTCKWGCYVAAAGTNDGCNPDPCANVAASDQGVYCGKSNQSGFGGGDPNTLYTCSNGATTQTRTCAKGCYVAAAGQQDGCN